MLSAMMRRKLTAGCLIVVSIVWSIDMISGEPTPQDAAAAPLPGTARTPPMPGDPPDRAAIERFLFHDDVPPESPPFERVPRDPFEPSERFHAALALPPPPTGAPAESADRAAATVADGTDETPFADRHRLEGVVAGRRPMALVDGRRLRIGDELDGHRLIKIERERAIFERDGVVTVLAVPPPRLP